MRWWASVRVARKGQNGIDAGTGNGGAGGLCVRCIFPAKAGMTTGVFGISNAADWQPVE